MTLYIITKRDRQQVRCQRKVSKTQNVFSLLAISLSRARSEAEEEAFPAERLSLSPANATGESETIRKDSWASDVEKMPQICFDRSILAD